jgi:hypothetical protein
MSEFGLPSPVFVPIMIVGVVSMERKRAYPQWVRYGRYLAIPHELLHVAGYRLAGQQCHYQWGDSYVATPGSMQVYKRLIGLLFPFATFATLCLIFGILSGLAYPDAVQRSSYFWFIFWTGLALITGSYAGTAIDDLRKAYLLIFKKPWYAWPPFDLFFWPVIDWSELRKRESASQNEKQI